MSNSIRFLGIAVLAWAAVRAVSLGMIPGTQALAFDARAWQPPRPRLPPIQPTLLPPIEPMAPAFQPPQLATGYGALAGNQAPNAGYPPYAPYPVYVPIPAGASLASRPQIIQVNPAPAGPGEVHVYGGLPANGMQNSTLALAEPVPARQSTPSFGQAKVPHGLNRLELSSWAMMRDQAGSHSLANGGTLGGSQAGARLMWQYDPHFAASLRASAPINSQRGGEAALGVRYQPLKIVPVALTVERRQAFGGDYSVGQSAFALFAEGGVYGRPMPWDALLDGYFQGGVVDFNNPDWFIDGQAAVTRPVWRNLSAGLGMWGGAQPGVSRFDMGPRLSLKVGARMRMHLDYRLKLVGNAQPGSGGVVTIAGDF